MERERSHPPEMFLSDEERRTAREERLKEFGLTIGERRTTGPNPRGAECFGIYKDGVHIGDVLSDSSPFVMTDVEFFSKVRDLLEFRKKFTLTVGDGADGVLRNMDVMLSVDNKLSVQLESGDYASVDLYNNGGNSSVEIVKVDETSVLVRCIEPGGKVIEYPIRNGVLLVSEKRVSDQNVQQ